MSSVEILIISYDLQSGTGIFYVVFFTWLEKNKSIETIPLPEDYKVFITDNEMIEIYKYESSI